MVMSDEELLKVDSEGDWEPEAALRPGGAPDMLEAERCDEPCRRPPPFALLLLDPSPPSLPPRPGGSPLLILVDGRLVCDGLVCLNRPPTACSRLASLLLL